jgi:hypothetical protein
MRLTKEIFLLALVIVYFVYWSYRFWGQTFTCRGLDPNFYRKFITKNVSCEDRCRNIFENFFNVPFNKCRPDFLTNPKTQRKLELDGFNPSIPTHLGLGLAFEYNGSQHYFFTPKYHKTVEEFEDQMSRDKLKHKLCKENGILLITIPYTVTDLEEFILKKVYENDLFYFIKDR